MSLEKSCQTNFSRQDIDRLDRSREIKVSEDQFGLDKSCQTNFTLSDLEDAVRSSNIESVREILLGNSIRWNRLDYLYYLGNIIALATLDCKNEKIYRLLVSFIEFGTDDRFVEMFIVTMLKGNVDLLELYIALLDHIKIERKLYRVGTLSGLLFCRWNLNTRKDMLKLLINGRVDTFTSKLSNYFITFIENHVERDDTDAAEIAQILLDSGAPLDEPDATGKRPLFHAVRNENIRLVSFLISKGADVDLSETHGLTALHLACALNNVPITTLLVENGANVSAQRDGGFTPLHRACSHGNDVIIELLLQRGAEIGVESSTGKTPLSLLKIHGDNYEKCMKAIAKEFSKLTFDNKTTCPKVLNVILENSVASEYFNKCTSDLNLMSTTKFHASYSYYSIFNKSITTKKLAHLTKNKELVAKFHEDSRKFSCYQKELLKNFQEAVDLKVNMETVESILYSLFGGAFPSLTIRKLTNFLSVENFPSQ